MIDGNHGVSGGGIYSATTISDSTIVNNTSVVDGAGVFDLGSSSITNTTINNNTAGNNAGAVRIDGSLSSITNTTISNNTAGHLGGGLYITTATDPAITNTVISNNTAASNGGGIYNSHSASLITNSVVADNTATSGSGIWNNGQPKITNSIVWANTGPQIRDAEAGVTTVTYSNVDGWTGGGTGNIDVAPMFNGSGDYRLQAGSPAIDAGDDTAVPADVYNVDDDGDTTEPTPDLDLQDRIQGAAVDMGAYEFIPPPNEPPTADADGPYAGSEGTPVALDGSLS